MCVWIVGGNLGGDVENMRTPHSEAADGRWPIGANPQPFCCETSCCSFVKVLSAVLIPVESFPHLNDFRTENERQ